MQHEYELLPILGAEYEPWNRGRRCHFIGTTAALIMGGLAAAGSIGGAAIAAHGAGAAADTLHQSGVAVGNSIDKATGGAIDSGYNGLTQANGALDTGLIGSTNSVHQGAQDATYALQQGKNDSTYALADARNNTLDQLKPYLAAGQQGVSGLSDMANGKWNFQTDPGYQFRLQEGMKALGSSAAAKGGALGGDALKAAGRYGQDYASNEYGKAYGRQFGTLSALAGIGQNATQQEGAANLGTGAKLSDVLTGTAGRVADNSLKEGALLSSNWGDWARLKSASALQGNQYIGDRGLQGAESAGQAYMGGANGQAAGQVAQGNAWGNAFSGVGNTLSQLYLMTQLGQGGGGSGSGSIPGFDPTLARP